MIEASGKTSEGPQGALLRVEGASRVFRMGEVEVPALVEVELEIARGEFLVILGPSGSGKSTLLNLVGGVDRATAGRVWYGDTDLTALTDEALTEFRRTTVGFIFQLYSLVPTLAAYENVRAAAEGWKNRRGRIIIYAEVPDAGPAHGERLLRQARVLSGPLRARRR